MQLTIYQGEFEALCALLLRFARCIARKLEFFQFITVHFFIATEQISVSMVDPFISGMI